VPLDVLPYRRFRERVEAGSLPLIRTSNPQKSIVKLKNLPMVQEIIGTSGDSDIVVRIGAASNEDLRETVVNKIQSMPGAVSTEIFLAFPKL